jgi:prepilin-type N-terminal cleavage/methylation domain-containing protein
MIRKTESITYNQKSSQGFTLVEVLAVVVIIASFSIILLSNFRMSAPTEMAKRQVAAVIESDIKRVQSMSLAGTQYGGNIACGYGIHYQDKKTYLIYAKMPPASGCSALSTRNYQAGDPILETRKISNPNLEFSGSFYDIFFEPPDPKTYINNSLSLSALPSEFIIQKKGQTSCAGQSCLYVRVYTSGRVDIAP